MGLKNFTVGGLIVTFNPEIELFKKVLESVIPQVSILIVVDNGSCNVNDIEKLNSIFVFRIIKNNQNQGIAKALNRGVSELQKVPGLEWIIFLD
ncbi:MAG: glycosyltransferase [Thermodesulfobium sp.]